MELADRELLERMAAGHGFELDWEKVKDPSLEFRVAVGMVLMSGLLEFVSPRDIPSSLPQARAVILKAESLGPDKWSCHSA